MPILLWGPRKYLFIGILELMSHIPFENKNYFKVSLITENWHVIWIIYCKGGSGNYNFLIFLIAYIEFIH